MAESPSSQSDAQIVVDRSLVARIEELERDRDRFRRIAEEYGDRAISECERADAAERCMDVMREAALRIKPMIRRGDHDDAMIAAQHIATLRPEALA